MSIRLLEVADTIESNRLEFKRNYTDDIKKEIVAFANTDGGELIIGMDDDAPLMRRFQQLSFST